MTSDLWSNSKVLCGEELDDAKDNAHALAPRDDNERRLVVAAFIVNRIRVVIRRELGYTVSAGIGHNMKFAKLVAATVKPYGQTVLLERGVPALLGSMPLRKIQGFGPKFMVSLFAIVTALNSSNSQSQNDSQDREEESLDPKTMTPADVLMAFQTREQMNMRLGRNAELTWNTCNGIDLTPIKEVKNIKKVRVHVCVCERLL
jgi:nucleotidyltransferase/DNA polymerase involved in DNA repair